MLSKAPKPTSNHRFKKRISIHAPFTIHEALMFYGEKKVNQALEGKYFHELQSALAILRK